LGGCEQTQQQGTQPVRLVRFSFSTPFTVARNELLEETNSNSSCVSSRGEEKTPGHAPRRHHHYDGGRCQQPRSGSPRHLYAYNHSDSAQCCNLTPNPVLIRYFVPLVAECLYKGAQLILTTSHVGPASLKARPARDSAPIRLFGRFLRFYVSVSGTTSTSQKGELADERRAGVVLRRLLSTYNAVEALGASTRSQRALTLNGQARPMCGTSTMRRGPERHQRASRHRSFNEGCCLRVLQGRWARENTPRGATETAAPWAACNPSAKRLKDRKKI
jgi:hypothetical protein